MKLAVLTSANQWYVPYARKLVKKFPNADLVFEHEKLGNYYNWVFALSYHRILPAEVLSSHERVLVVHESALPAGKGWAPLFWQVLEGKNDIVFSLLEASEKVDSGDIYMQRTMHLCGDELNADLRRKQAELTEEMCLEYFANPDKYLPAKPQQGEESFYPKRTPEDSALDPSKTIAEQFNLLRVVNNEEYPAFFTIAGKRYYVKIEKADT